MKKLNPLFDTDSYKVSQFSQYPVGTSKIYSYFESRLGEGFEKIVFFGLQYIIKNTLMNQITHEDVDYAKQFFKSHMGIFNEEGWRYIVNEHNGYLPLQIKAVPEGTVLTRGNVLITIESTDSNVPWLPQYIETVIVRNWSMINVATISYQMKLILLDAFTKSSDSITPKQDVLFKLHDFGSRGTYSQEAAGIGGMGHLVNFLGSDTVAAIMYAQDTYNTDEMLAYSIPGSEHSCVTSWGQNGEKAAFENMIKTYGGKTPFLAMVVDSYDLEYAVKEIIGVQLKDLIINCGSTVVIRPDSGEPKVSVLKCLTWLSEAFGYTVNSKGYKVLPDCVRVIQGDGITMQSLPDIVKFILGKGYSIDNIAFGMGGGLLAKHDRDTFRFAQKCSYIEINGVGNDVRKMPKTDMTKASKGGKLKLVLRGGEYYTVKDDGKNLEVDQLQVVYFFNKKFGHTTPVFNECTFSDIRARTGTW
jgi:nicotinamide phosphoribosyltransferase